MNILKREEESSLDIMDLINDLVTVVTVGNPFHCERSIVRPVSLLRKLWTLTPFSESVNLRTMQILLLAVPWNDA